MSQNSNSNEIAASTQLSNTYIMSNNILRNVYQIGFNSRNITKTITNNLEIKEISSNIIKDTKNNIISVRSYGPLLLGLVLIYKKKIILFIEDVFNTLKPKFYNINNNNFIDEEKSNSNNKKETQSEIKLKLNSENFNIMSLTPIKHENTFFNKNNEEDEYDNKYYNNIFTPDKKKAAKDLLTMDSNEMLRRSINNSLLTDKINSSLIKNKNSNNNNNNSNVDGSINNLSSLLQKEKLKKPLTEIKLSNNNKKNSLLNNNINFNDSNFFDNNNKDDDFNFFNFINNKNENEINNNDNFNNNNNNDFSDFTDTSNVFDNNLFNMKEKTTITKHTFKEIESIFTDKEKKQKPFVFKNKNLEFDEEISLPIKNIQEYTKENNFDIDDITNKFKNNLILQNKTLDTSNLEAFNNQSKYEYLAPSFIVVESENENNSIETKRNNELSFSNNNFNVSNFLISEKKKISIGSFSNVGKDLINDLSKLNLDKNDFEGILFDEKIEEIEKENKNKNQDDINNEEEFNNFNENFNNDFIDENVNINNNDENDDDINYSNIKENINKKEINELFKEINNNILSKKKKEINFPNLSKKIKKCDNSNINENNIPQSKLFYDLLVLAQLGKIDLNQKEIFNNESINIKIN